MKCDEKSKVSEWQPIEAFSGKDRQEVDVWMNIYPSPRSMGMGDSFRVVDAYKVNGKWFHRYKGKETELFADYITHWMPIPQSPEIQS